MINETLTVIKNRFSCKAFKDELPEKEKIQAIVQSAIASPSATNQQSWQIIVVTDKNLISEMENETIRMMSQIPTYKSFYDIVTSTGMKLFYNAPCMIVISIDKNNPYSSYDCGIVSQSISISAQSLDVASHIISINELVFLGEKSEYFKEKLKFPKNYEFGLSVLIGNEEISSKPHTLNFDKITYID